MRRRTLTAATSLAVLFSSVVLLAAPASADSAKLLPIKSAGDVVVDGAHQRIFISDPYQGKIVATDYRGTVVGSVTSLPGVDGLQLSADSGTVYAASPGADAIVAVDTALVQETERYATGEGTDPAHLALAGGKLWFGYGTKEHGYIGSLDVSGTEPVVALDQDPDTTYPGAPLLASTPGAPNTLAAAAPEYYGSWLGVYDVTSGTATRTARAGGSGSDLGSTSDLAFTPDGSRLITANPGNQHRVWQTSDLTQVSTYTTQHHPSSVAIAADGTLAAGTDAPYDPSLFIFNPGTTTAVRTYTWPDTDTISGYDELGDANLAWEPGETAGRLFAVTHNHESEYTLRVLTDAPRSKPVLTVDAPASAARARTLTVKGTLTATLPLPAGTPLDVTRFDLESPDGKSLGTKSLGSGGKFSFTDKPPAGGKVKYKVTYAGDATHTPASAADTVAVSRAKPALTLNNNGKKYAYGADARFTAHLGTTYKNRTVEIWADPFGPDKPKKLVKSGRVNSNGNLSVTLDLRRDTKVTAKFAGDARYRPRSVSSTVGTRVKVSTAVGRHYTTRNTWGHTYYYFHKSRNPLFTTTMTAYPHREQRLQFQVYYQGTWYDGGSKYFPLSSAGVSKVELTGTHDTGWRFRVRSSYIDSTSGDNVNSTTHGAWKYFYFTN
ncbi:Ig-like domain repeat protein [Streptomyces luteolifulvus]|uniref:Ig-like domain repeat protein n=1 Tax=Streptomyces luteolifulvus TaxID=2615112 RepID=A0A6H9V6L9_9ACTN|nr:Ig-like domain repeat protein [Streptomyces luteolifulvus]KAB1149432.1 Ig-like domain repeat protein [Streptomyces luteolifulvus]